MGDVPRCGGCLEKRTRKSTSRGRSGRCRGGGGGGHPASFDPRRVRFVTRKIRERRKLGEVARRGRRGEKGEGRRSETRRDREMIPHKPSEYASFRPRSFPSLVLYVVDRKSSSSSSSASASASSSRRYRRHHRRHRHRQQSLLSSLSSRVVSLRDRRSRVPFEADKRRRRVRGVARAQASRRVYCCKTA